MYVTMATAHTSAKLKKIEVWVVDRVLSCLATKKAS